MATQQQAEGRLSKLKLKLVDMEVIGRASVLFPLFCPLYAFFSIYSYHTIYCTVLIRTYPTILSSLTLYCALYSPVLHLPSISSVLCTVLISCIRTSGMKWRSWIIQKRPQCHVMRYVLCVFRMYCVLYCTTTTFYAYFVYFFWTVYCTTLTSYKYWRICINTVLLCFIWTIGSITHHTILCYQYFITPFTPPYSFHHPLYFIVLHTKCRVFVTHSL